MSWKLTQILASGSFCNLQDLIRDAGLPEDGYSSFSPVAKYWRYFSDPWDSPSSVSNLFWEIIPLGWCSLTLNYVTHLPHPYTMPIVADGYQNQKERDRAVLRKMTWKEQMKGSRATLQFRWGKVIGWKATPWGSVQDCSVLESEAGAEGVLQAAKRSDFLCTFFLHISGKHTRTPARKKISQRQLKGKEGDLNCCPAWDDVEWIKYILETVKARVNRTDHVKAVWPALKRNWREGQPKRQYSSHIYCAVGFPQRQGTLFAAMSGVRM